MKRLNKKGGSASELGKYVLMQVEPLNKWQKELKIC